MIEDESAKDAELAMFGVIKRGDKFVPILKRQAEGKEACKDCRGFGTYGNPLCGAVYTCQACNGDGKRRPNKAIVAIKTFFKTYPFTILWVTLSFSYIISVAMGVWK